jgi:UDP-N-acetyl-2-amino-2-deoxyglucuronate dehydrogenase
MSAKRFAIAGCGRIAWRHAEQIATYGQLVTVLDIETPKAEKLAAAYKVKPTNTWEELLSRGDIDVLSVCTPNGLHAQHSCQGLGAGMHVICEKPMALNVADAQHMMAVAKKAGRRLFVVKQNRYNPPVVAVRKALDEGRLGKIFSIQVNGFWQRGPGYYNDNWRGTRQLDGGTLFTQFSHFIDLMYWLAGDVEEVTAILSNYAHQGLIEFEDTGVVTFRFSSGAIGTMHYTVNSYEKNFEGSITLFCEKGTVKIGGQYLNTLEYEKIDGYTIGELEKGKGANDYGSYQGSMSNHDKVYRHVVESLNTKGADGSNAGDALKTVEIIEKIYTAARRL